MKEKEEKMHLPKVTIDDFFTNQEERDAQKLERVQKLRITQISSFPNHPFKVKDDEKMFETVESVKQHGVLAPAIEISYLSNNEQDMLLEAIETSLATPSTPQAKRLREESEKGTLNEETIQNILYEEKPNQKEQVKFTYDRVKKYFPKGYTIQQMEGVIEKLLQKYQIQWQNKQFER